MEMEFFVLFYGTGNDVGNARSALLSTCTSFINVSHISVRFFVNIERYIRTQIHTHTHILRYTYVTPETHKTVNDNRSLRWLIIFGCCVVFV